ncbi:MAG: M23 family metallopeptidase [Chloroflexi bacterium]|nr:M23 family metallopeptidase [Chloroflexota bacterium]
MVFKSPVGTEEERNSGKIWPGGWSDAQPYNTHYDYGYHTGADLNWNTPRWDADKHAPVYSIGNGIVTYAQLFSTKYWGNIIVIDHGMVDGKPLFSRYGHVEKINVVVGQSVTAEDRIAGVGDGNGIFKNNHHLHFDISATNKLSSTPHYWPQEDRKGLQAHFVNPRDWLRQQHVVDGIAVAEDTLASNVITNNVTDNTPQAVKPSATSTVWYVIASSGVTVRKNPGVSGEEVSILPRGSKISLEAQAGNQDGYTWGRISGGKFHGNWLAIFKQDRSESYASTNPPRI